MRKSVIHSVTTMTPLRVSLVGGGTDFPAFYNLQNGLVVSMTIQKFIYVTVKRHSPLFGEKYRISYSETEHVNTLDEIRNDIARECIRLVGIEEPLFISTASDLPAGSGLGSSSSFAVGLLHALHEFTGDVVSVGQLAEEACEVEINILHRPIGKQDQYAAAFGGLNSFKFYESNRVSIDSITLNSEGYSLLNDLILIWTGMSRKAENILQEQNENIGQNLVYLNELYLEAESLKNIMTENKLNSLNLSSALNKNWQLKRKFASGIANKEIDSLYEECMASGASGGKLLGAGGGGFIMANVPETKRKEFFEKMQKYPAIPVTIEHRGTRILSRVDL
jgi:D-glycero-alpha-D-manno-heptose-7-phosphate kinase